MASRLLPMTRRRGMFAPLENLREEMDRLFNDWLGEAEAPMLPGEGAFFTPRLNVVEGDKHLKVTTELPGLELSDVDVELEPRRLTISGHKSEEKEEKGNTFFRRERHYGSFHREIPLPWEVDTAETEADATFENGVLTVTVPKPKDVPSSRRRIEIKSR